jgi:hypothetical protein
MPAAEELAYALWEARGRPLGDDWADWFGARHRLGDAAPAGTVRVWKTPLTISVDLNGPLGGFSLASARPGEQLTVQRRGFLTSDTGALLYTCLDSLFFGPFGAALRGEGVRAEDIDNCLVNVVDGTKATLWLNFPTVIDSIAKTSLKVGDPITSDSIADVRGVSFQGVEMPARGAIAYTFQLGWRRALYFDFSMATEDPNRPLENLPALLGSLHAALIFRERIQMQPEILGRMFKAGWFPFIRLPDDLAVALYRRFQEGWDHAPAEADIIKGVSPMVPGLLTGWSSKAAFKPHMDVLTNAVRLFEKGEFAATSALLLPKVEGILRTLNMGRGRASARDLRANLLARVRAQVSGITAFLPEAFVQYLETFYYAGFDLDANDVPPSRHAFMHGVGPDAEAAKPGLPLKLLLMLDQLFFYV